jgi:DNA-binding transcriptional LysR family regulator
MNVAQLQRADLNLLVVFAVFCEERSVSAAAERLFRTQPAVSRALDRLRAMFGDELFIRRKSGYELTPHATRILKEMEETLPKLDRLLRGSEFDPLKEEAHFKIVCTDYAMSMLGPEISRRALQEGSKVSLAFVAFSESAYQDLEQGHAHLVLQAQDESLPGRIATEKLFEEELVCVVSKRMGVKSAMSLKQYAAADHIVVSVHGSIQAFPDKVLLRLGVRRRAKLRVPYFVAAIEAVESSGLVASIPRRLAEKYSRQFDVRIVSAPPELQRFEYWMAWHPRLNTDAAHQWLRHQVRLSAKPFQSPKRHSPSG